MKEKNDKWADQRKNGWRDGTKWNESLITKQKGNKVRSEKETYRTDGVNREESGWTNNREKKEKKKKKQEKTLGEDWKQKEKESKWKKERKKWRDRWMYKWWKLRIKKEKKNEGIDGWKKETNDGK